MHIMIIVSSCGTLLGQSLTKTAFAATLLKLTRGFSHWKACHWVLWYCIVSMNLYNLSKVSQTTVRRADRITLANMAEIVVEWGKVCDSPSYFVWYRLDFCLNSGLRNRYKEAGNCESTISLVSESR